MADLTPSRIAKLWAMQHGRSIDAVVEAMASPDLHTYRDHILLGEFGASFRFDEPFTIPAQRVLDAMALVPGGKMSEAQIEVTRFSVSLTYPYLENEKERQKRLDYVKANYDFSPERVARAKGIEARFGFRKAAEYLASKEK